jgi:glycerol kinase
VPGLRERAEKGEVRFGTMDTWLITKLTGRHATDVTNASRTMLMNLRRWTGTRTCSPRSTSRGRCCRRSCRRPYVYGEAAGFLAAYRWPARSATSRPPCSARPAFAEGEAKCTYGTGSFLLLHTGDRPVRSERGLVTTVAYGIGDERPAYALEGSIAVTGALVQWLRDNLGLISTAAEVNDLAATVEDNGGCYIVPAFSGLFAPHWRPDARGVIAGLTGT